MQIKKAKTKSLLCAEETELFWEQGYLHISTIFDEEETRELSEEMDRLISAWAIRSKGWSGDWRGAYMDEETEKRSELIAMHNLFYYSAAWARAVMHPRLVAGMADLLGPDVELHHTTMHVKPPQTGQPFPMHQDHPFYAHEDERYIDVLVHLDDTFHENGEIRFLGGSHKSGPLEHIRQTAEGDPCSPHLPTDKYHLEDTVPVPAKAGDIVAFNINTIHGSYINKTDRDRRLVRIGYRHPDNVQIAGQGFGKPGWMVAGKRTRKPGQELF